MLEDAWVMGLLLFAAGAAVSLAASWLLVSRLERLGERVLDRTKVSVGNRMKCQ